MLANRHFLLDQIFLGLFQHLRGFENLDDLHLVVVPGAVQVADVYILDRAFHVLGIGIRHFKAQRAQKVIATQTCVFVQTVLAGQRHAFNLVGRPSFLRPMHRMSNHEASDTAVPWLDLQA